MKKKWSELFLTLFFKEACGICLSASIIGLIVWLKADISAEAYATLSPLYSILLVIFLASGIRFSWMISNNITKSKRNKQKK